MGWVLAWTFGILWLCAGFEITRQKELVKHFEAKSDRWKRVADSCFDKYCTLLRLVWRTSCPGVECPGCDSTGVLLTEEGMAECPICKDIAAGS